MMASVNLMLALVAVVCMWIETEQTLIKFENGFEYQYTYDSKSTMHEIGDFHIRGKLGYVPFAELEDGQELLVRVHSFHIKNRDREASDGWDLSQWFSFVMNPRGEVLRTYHPDDEEPEVLALKKGFASLISGKFYVEHEGVVKHDNGQWSYRVKEYGQEGHHNATYNAERTKTGIKFTKSRDGHPVYNAKSDYQKEMHYHPELKIIHQVNTRENFASPREPPKGYDHREGMRPTLQEDNRPQDQFTLPDMRASTSGQLTFLTRIRVKQTIKRPAEEVTEGETHIGHVPKKITKMNFTDALIYIKGNLTCLRKTPEGPNGGHDSMRCSNHIVHVLTAVDPPVVTRLMQQFFNVSSRQRRFPWKYGPDQKSLIDALCNWKEAQGVDLLTDFVLRSPLPNPAHLEHFFIAMVTSETEPTQKFLATLENFILDPKSFPILAQGQEVYHKALLCFGSMAGVLKDRGLLKDSHGMIAKVEKMLGLHDPWLFREKRSVMTEFEQLAHETRKVILLESLGNAGLDRSMDHILSHINTTSTKWIKRAGLHALRNYHTDKAAAILWTTAISSGEETVAHEARALYQLHPKADKGTVQAMSAHESGPLIQTLQQHPRYKRAPGASFTTGKSIWDGIDFKINAPGINWIKQFGSPDIGIAFGLILANGLNLTLTPLESQFQIVVHDEFYVRMVLGCIGLNIDLFVVRICFKGKAKLDLNVFQEFSPDKLMQKYNQFMDIADRVYNTMVSAVSEVKGITDSGDQFTDLMERLMITLEEIPEKIQYLKVESLNATVQVGEMWDWKLPAWVKAPAGAIGTINNFAALFKQISDGVMNFYNAVREPILVTLPNSFMAIWNNLKELVEKFDYIKEDPMGFVKVCFKVVFSVSKAVIEVLYAVKKIETTAFFVKKEPPAWMKIRTLYVEWFNKVKGANATVSRKRAKWVDAPTVGEDPVKKMTKGTITAQQMKGQVMDRIQGILTHMLNTFLDLLPLPDSFIDAYLNFYNMVAKVKKAYNQLKTGYDFVTTVIDRVMGVKSHKRFPKTFRTVSDDCAGTGFYPSELQMNNPTPAPPTLTRQNAVSELGIIPSLTRQNAGIVKRDTNPDGTYRSGYHAEYTNEGVDLVVEENMYIVAPFPGTVSVTNIPNQVRLKTTGNSLKYTYIYITNVLPNNTFPYYRHPWLPKVEVSAGQVIGTSAKSPCAGKNHIHVAFKKWGRYVDPTRFIEERALPLPKWDSVCDDYKAVWKIRVVAAGSIIGLAGKKMKARKSPKRVPGSDAVVEPPAPAPAAPPEAADPKKVTESMTTGQQLKTGIKNTQDAIVQDFTDMKQALSYSAIREKMRNFTVCSIKLGVIFEFMSQFGLTESMTKLSETLIFFKEFNTKKWCLNPNTLTVDELKGQLSKRGLSTMGGKKVLIKRFTSHTQTCPLLQFTMPKNIFCTYDSFCLATTCCMTFNFVYFIKTIDFYARFDPCDFKFVVGFGKAYTQPWRNWNPRDPDLQGMQSADFEWSLTDVFFGEEGIKYTNIKTDIADAIVLSIRYSILKSEKEMMASVSAGFCFEDNLDDCIEPFQDILKDAVFPIPICNPDGSMTWPVVDYKSYFNRAQVAESLKEQGRVVEAAQKQAAIDAFLTGFGLPSSFAIPTAPCSRPERKTLAQLSTYYTTNGLSADFVWDGNFDNMAAATILSDKKCTTKNGGIIYELPAFATPAMESSVYPKMAAGCNQIDLCIDLNSTTANVTKSIDANIDLNYCDYVITVTLGGVSQTFLMFLYPWGEQQYLQIGDNVAMNYTISRDLDTREFTVDAYFRMCSGSDCLVEGPVYQNLVVPMLNCSRHVPFPLPGVDIVGFLDQLEGHNMTEEAFDAILTQYRLGSYRQERIMQWGSCVNVSMDSPAVSCASNVSSVNYLSPEASMLANCSLSSTCHGVQCCIDLPFKVNGFSNTNHRHTWVSFEFHECNYTIDVRIGSWSYTARLLDYDWGRTMEGSIGVSPDGLTAPIQWSAKIDVPASENAKVLVEHYTIDFNVSFCLPLNASTDLCIPDVNGFTLLRQFEVEACHNDTSFAIQTNVDSQSVNQWMNVKHAATDVRLGEAGVEQFLDETGLVYTLQHRQCDPMRGIYDPAASGWNRIGCTASLPNFLQLPDNVRCFMSSLCSDIDCCMTVDMFGMYTRTIHSTFKVDTCAYELSGSIELMRFSFTLFFYDWGAVKTYHIRDIFYIQFAISRDTIARTVTVDLNLKMCLEPNSPCDMDVEIFKQTIIPMTACNLAEIVALPTGYSIRSFIPAQGLTLGDPLTDEIEEAILRHLGLATSLTPSSKLYCDSGYTAEYSHCSAFISQGLSQVSSCRMDNRCYGFECCFDLDLEFLTRASRLHAYVDPCDYKLAIMWDDYSFNCTLYTFPWGEHKTELIGTSVYMNYTISKSATLFTLSVAIYTAIEDFTYTHFTVLNNAQFPIPQCDYARTFDLGKRLPAFANEILVDGPASDYAWEAVFRSLGLHSLMDDPCPENHTLNYCPHLPDPSTFVPSYANCHYDELCRGLHCCLDVNFYIGTWRMKAWTVYDACTYELSYGLEKFSYDAALPDMTWGQQFQNELSSNLVFECSVNQPSPDIIQYDSTMTLFTESYENYEFLKATQIPTPTCNTGYDSLSWMGGSFDHFVSMSHIAAKIVNPNTNVFRRLHLDQYFFDMNTCSLSAQTSPSHTCPGFVLSDGSKTNTDNQCQVSDGCLKVECCALNKHMMGNMSLNLEFNFELLPCNYSISFKLETHTWTANIFENFGLVNNYTIGNSLVVQWTLGSNDRGSLMVTVDIMNKVDGSVNGRTRVVSNALLELPTCDSVGTLTWPATSNSAAEQTLGEGADVLMSLLNVNTDFFRHSECAIPTPNYNITDGCPHLDTSNLPPSVNCSHVETCTGLECCITIDTKMVARSYKTWAIIDPCDYSISFGFEQWQFNDTLVGYTYGTPRTVSIASTMVISYTVNITDDLKRVLISMSLMINAPDYGLDIPEVVVFNGIPVYMPACDENRTLEYTNDLLGQTYGRNVTVEEAPSGIAVNRLGVRPEVLTGEPCVTSPTPDAVKCPHIPSIPATSDSGYSATCSAGYNKCTSIHCCVEMDLGVAPLAMTMYLELDPCTFALSAGFERVYENTTYIGDFGWGTEQELVIGETLVMRYNIEKSVDNKDFFFTLKLSTCQNCSTGFTVANQVQFPIPSCEEDGSFRWPSSDTMTVNGESVEMPSALIMNRMGIQAEELFAEECSSPGQSATCPFISIGSMPSDVQCGISDKCTGVECCVTLDLEVVKRNFRIWTMIDPCDYVFSIGFERHSFNVSLLGYNWGVERVENVGAFDINYNLTKSSNNHAFTLDMSFYLCLEGVCSNFTILNGTSFVIPYCDPTTHAISWPTHMYSNMLTNVLGVTSDFLMPVECAPTTVPLRCRATRLPSFGSDNCFVQSNCMGVMCCFEEDLLVEKRNMHAWFEIFHCQSQFGYAVENFNRRRSLSSISSGQQYNDTIGESLTLTYSIEETPMSYYVFMSLTKCWRDTEGNPSDCSVDVIMDATMFSKPTCARKRRRRSANLRKMNTMYDTGSATTTNTVRGAASSGMSNPEMSIYFGSPNTTKPGSKAAAADAAAKKYGNFPSMCNYKSAAQFGAVMVSPDTAMVENSDGNTVSIKGANSINNVLGANSATTTARDPRSQFHYKIGFGPTSAGNKYLGAAMANMTIGQFEATLNINGMPPTKTLKLFKDLTDVFVLMAEEFINNLLDGKGADGFSIPDFTLKGQVPMPKKVVNIFKKEKFFLLGGMVPMTFGMGFDVYYGLNITVSAKVVQMTAGVLLKPFFGFMVWGELGLGALIYGKLRLEGDICEVGFPLYGEINFARSPIAVGGAICLEIVPVRLRLFGMVTIEVDLGLTTVEEIAFKKLIWSYASEPITFCALNETTAVKDNSPPQFTGYTTTTAGKRDAPTDSCEVEQLPDRDHTEPAFEISVKAQDDRSEIRLFMDVGTVRGGDDTIKRRELGGPSTVIVETLSNVGVPLYFTISAENDGGGSAKVTCELPSYDVTEPAGRVLTAFKTTSNPRILRGSAMALEDSPLTSQTIGLGFGKDIYGDQILPWTEFTLSANDGITAPPGSGHFTDMRLGRLNAPIVEELKMNSFEDCAIECLKKQPWHCMAFNYDQDFDNQVCELLSGVEGGENTLSESGFFYYFERLGAGHAVEFSEANLWMTHNELIYHNVHFTNYLNYASILSSEATLVDLTPPEPGHIENAESDELRWETCHETMPDNQPEWPILCREQSTEVPNHRWLRDGPGSKTVFNGLAPLFDLLYTRANKYISANWDGIHDDETGVHGYSWGSGTTPCEEMIHVHADPHINLFSAASWDYKGVLFPLPAPFVILEDGRYYMTVRALNKVEFGGPMALSVCHMTPYVIDNTRPVFYEIYNVGYKEGTHTVFTSYNASDDLSNIQYMDFCLGETTHDCNVMDWYAVDHNENYTATAIFNIINIDFPVWPKLQAVNGVNLTRIKVSPYPLLIDMTPPIAGTVNDGNLYEVDISFQKDANQICMNWLGFYDPESGISSFLVAVGTTPNGTDISTGITLGNHVYSYCVDLESDNLLQHNTMYYSTVWAYNGGHKQLNTSATSNGVLVDLTAPLTGDLVDGLEEDFTDIVYNSNPATVDAQWRDYSDPESGIMEYRVQVEIASNMTFNYGVAHAWEAVSINDSSIEWHHFHLHHRDRVRTKLMTTNHALNDVTTSSDSYIVDLTPPVVTFLGDGATPGTDIDYQSVKNEFSSNWDFYDEESGVDHSRTMVYQMHGGSKLQFYPTTRGVWSMESDPTTKVHTDSSLSLTTGAHYSSKVASTNNARLSAPYHTDGAIIDDTAPHMQFVHTGAVSGASEEIVQDNVWQADPNGIRGSWLGIDGESGITEYFVAVGTSPGDTSVSDWRSMGDKTDGYIGGLTLTLCDITLKTPQYYISVKAVNGAGLECSSMTGSPLLVVDEDKIGFVIDGPEDTEESEQAASGVDIDYQTDTATLTCQWEGFESTLHGIRHYEWAVGSTPRAEDVKPFMGAGIILREHLNPVGVGLPGAGKASSPLDLEQGKTYYCTIRAFTGGENLLEAVSDGFIVDLTPPTIELIDIGLDDNSTDLTNSSVHYQISVDSLSAEWEYKENETKLAQALFAYGSYPGSDDIWPWTNVGPIPNWLENSVPIALVQPENTGMSNILSVKAFNNLGLWTQIHSGAVVVDSTPPVEGTVICPETIPSVDQLECTWSGFYDSQSPITAFTFGLGTQENVDDVYNFATLDASKSKHVAKSFLKPLAHRGLYYASVTAINSVGMIAMAFSQPITIDNTPPVNGMIVELPGIYYLSLDNPGAVDTRNTVICNTTSGCNAIDATCQESLTQIAVVWTEFTDPETPVVRYQLAIGTTPGGGQVLQFFDVELDDPNVFSYVISGMDMTGLRQVFVTVKGFNEAGLSSVAISNGVFLAYTTQGLAPLYVFDVFDTKDSTGDKDYQVKYDTLSGRWDFSGDPCPMASYSWSIERIDGTVAQDTIDLGSQTYGDNDNMMMSDYETYFLLVNATNVLGFSQMIRSDGIAIQRDPLYPGTVNDGDVTGFDLLYWPFTDKIIANWAHFGVQNTASFKPQVLSGNPVENTAETQIDTRNQGVDYYEIAVGTDRRNIKTRDNVIPFTNVGRNLTHTFFDLDLVPLTAFYYVTIRAHSFSQAVSEVTSNGFLAGYNQDVLAQPIQMRDYWNNASYLSLHWDTFTASPQIMYYHVGLANHSMADGYNCKGLIEGGDVTADEKAELFNVVGLTNLGTNSMLEIFNMSLVHNSSYYVMVIGVNEAGKCNSSSYSFTVDVTNVVEGRLKNGPYYGQNATYTDSVSEIKLVWEDYHDPTSGIKSFELSLWTYQTCSLEHSDNATLVVDWITLNGNYTEYTFTELTLELNKPYFVIMRTTNWAYMHINTTTVPILVDTSTPTAGAVVDGLYYLHDARWNGFNDFLEVTFLHWQDGTVTACEDRPIDVVQDPAWSKLAIQGLLVPSGEEWNIVYKAEEVQAMQDSSAIGVRMIRDTKGSRMYSGAYSIEADFVSGGKYQVDLQAANGTGHAITSLLFWDGPSNMIGEYIVPMEEDWASETCRCCYEDPVPVDCMCNCTKYMEALAYYNITLPPEPTTTMASNVAPVPWAIQRAALPEDNVDSIITNMAQDGQPACGLQLHPGTVSYVNLWCRFSNDTYEVIETRHRVDFDLTVWNSYEIEFYLFYDQSTAPTRCVHVKIANSDEHLASLCGIPELTNSTQMIFHVFNSDNYVPPLTDTMNPWSVTSYMRAVRLPPSSDKLCRYGDPFTGGTNPIISYEAAVGYEAGTEDVVPFTPMLRPCVPCGSSCSRYLCTPGCNGQTMDKLVITIPDLELSYNRTIVNETGLNTTEQALYHVSVKAILASGESAVTSSNGVGVDITPPDTEEVFYIDVSRDPYAPINFMSSNTTVKALWTCSDAESGIAENFWAIGSYPGGTDIQDFISVGEDVTGINSGLEGLIQHNISLYVSVRCVNGGGLSNMIIDTHGILPLLIPPAADDVQSTLPDASPFPVAVNPPNTMESDDPTTAGATWTVSSDETIRRYEFCLGSSNASIDDIFPCTWVGYNTTGKVEIKNGYLTIDDIQIRPLSEFRAPGTNNTMPVSTNNFQMEVGRAVFTHMKLCNEAEVCVIKFVGTTMVVDSASQLETATAGGSIAASLTASRRKRSTGDTFSVVTPSGLEDGQSILLGELSASDLSTSYSSDASANYQSYIVNPADTSDMVDRSLDSRVHTWPTSGYYLSPVGGLAMPGALELTVSYDPSYLDSITDTRPALMHWDSDNQKWAMSEETCSGESNVLTYDTIATTITTKVCSTREDTTTSTSRRKKRSTSSTYFSTSTMFMVGSISTTVTNNAPNLTSLTDLWMDEDAGTLVYTMTAYDVEGDTVIYQLDSSLSSVTTGTVSLASDGTFSYQPCTDCYGMDYIPIILTEDQTGTNITAAYSYYNISMNVSEVSDSPSLAFSQFGVNLFPSASNKSIVITVDKNHWDNYAYSPYTFLVLGYDVDDYDNLTISVQNPSYGTLSVGTVSRDTVTLPSSCPVSSAADDLPCSNMNLDHSSTAYKWAVSSMTYTPNTDFYGWDEFRIVIGDTAGLYSDLLQVYVAVLENPCQHNGTCVGPADDPSCTSTTRTAGYSGYSCQCNPGWSGDWCQTDTDDCVGAPCSYPLACYDMIDGYRCACPQSWPNCEVEFTAWMATMASVFLLIIIGVAVGIACYKFRLKRQRNPNMKTKAYYDLTKNRRNTKKMNAFDNKALINNHEGTIPGTIGEEEEYSRPPTAASMYSENTMTPVPRISRPESVLSGKFYLSGVPSGESTDDSPSSEGSPDSFKRGLLGRLRPRWQGMIDKKPKIALPWGLNINKLTSTKTSHIQQLEESSSSSRSSLEDSNRAPTRQSIYSTDSDLSAPPMVSFPGAATPEGYSPTTQMSQQPLSTLNRVGASANANRPSNATRVGTATTVRKVSSSNPSIDRRSKPSSARPSVDRRSKPGSGTSRKTAWSTGEDDKYGPASYDPPPASADISDW